MKSDFFCPQGNPPLADSYYNEKFNLFSLSQIKGLGSHTIYELLQQYQSPNKILANPDKLPPNIGKLIVASQNDTVWQRQLSDNYANYKNCLSILDEQYPSILKTIYDPPLFLFYRGNLDLLTSNYLFTIVGSRRLTDYHQKSLRQIINDLQNTPLILVSGLALGIDGLVHQLALNNNLPTIAVLGSGLDDKVLYPASNKNLADKILKESGLLLSEYPPNTKPELYNFPRRNRILAGLSKMTLVISGAAKSGTLITAQIALDEAREVWALPGNIDSTLSQGPNQLIKQGANLLLSTEDILQVYNLKNKIKATAPVFDNSLQRTIYSLAQLQPLTANQLSMKLQIDLTMINQTISQMELKNWININQANQVEII